jgi:hypothetical protein
MTHQMQTTALDEIMELLAEHGFDGLPQAMNVLLYEVIKLERAHAPGADPYQRSEHRRGQVTRTPAMAAGLAGHRWMMRELLSHASTLPPLVAPKADSASTQATVGVRQSKGMTTVPCMV